MKVHIIWIPKFRKPVLQGDVAIRVRDIIRRVAAEPELEIISGKVACDHVHVFVSHRPHQEVSDSAAAEGNQLADVNAGVSAHTEAIFGAAFLGT